MDRAERRRLERLNQQQSKARAKMNLTPEQKKIHEAFTALDEVVKSMRVTVPTGKRIADAFGRLAMEVDNGMQEIADADKPKAAPAETKPAVQ